MFADKNAVLAGLANTPKSLSAFVADIPEELRQRRRGQGFWTIAEHLDHLAQVQPMLLERLRRFVAEETPSFIPFIPESGEEQREKSCLPAEQALQQFTAMRRNQLELLFAVDETIWQRQGSHPEYDRYSLVILTRHMLMHDYWHMYRMEELWLAKDQFLTALG